MIEKPLGWIMSMLYQFTNDYGLALITFAVLVKVLLLPATAKGKKSAMKMSRITPRIKAIQAKYANDQEKQNQAIQALYREEGVSVGGGCLWSLLPLLVLIPLWNVIREPIKYMLTDDANVIKKILELTKQTDQIKAAPLIPQIKDQLKAAFPTISEATLKGINFEFLKIDLSQTPMYNIFSKDWVWDWNHIGATLLPLLSAGGQLLSIMISQSMNNSVITDEKGIQDKKTADESQQAQTGKMMMWIGPIMSLLFGFGMAAAMSLYWFVQGIVSTVADVYLTKKYRKIYDAEDAVRMQKYLEEEAIEAEKERIRAERRAANPEGITENTSKKKMQQAKQKEQEAAKAAAAKEYAVKKGAAPAEEASEPEVLSGIADRPFCKGRAYDPNRYNKEN